MAGKGERLPSIRTFRSGFTANRDEAASGTMRRGFERARVA